MLFNSSRKDEFCSHVISGAAIILQDHALAVLQLEKSAGFQLISRGFGKSTQKHCGRSLVISLDCYRNDDVVTEVSVNERLQLLYEFFRGFLLRQDDLPRERFSNRFSAQKAYAILQRCCRFTLARLPAPAQIPICGSSGSHLCYRA